MRTHASPPLPRFRRLRGGPRITLAAPGGLLTGALLALALFALPIAARGQDRYVPAEPLRLPGQGMRLGTVPEDVPTPLLDAATRDAAQGPAPRTLEDFVQLAMENHPRLRAARAAVEAARGKAVQARLYPNPVIAGFSPQLAGNESQWSGTVAQDLVTAGKLRLAEQAALREVQRAEYELIRARFDVLADVRRTFYGLLVSQRRVEIFNLLLDIAKRSYDIGRQLAEAGEGTKADVLFWSIERDRAEVRLLNSAVFIETGRREVAAAVGLPRADVGRIEGDLLRKLPNFDLKDLQQAVVQANALPRAAEADIARAQWTLERAVVQPIPNVNLMGGYQRQVGIPAMDQGLVQVMMAVPLFDRNQGNIRAARADIASSRANLRGIELDLATRTAQAIATYRTSQRLTEWYEEYILPKAKETVALTQTLYARGEVTFLSLLQAQKILTETELAFVEAQAERWTSAVQIADLLQLEQFPPAADAPAAIQTDDTRSELRDTGAEKTGEQKAGDKKAGDKKAAAKDGATGAPQQPADRGPPAMGPQRPAAQPLPAPSQPAAALAPQATFLPQAAPPVAPVPFPGARPGGAAAGPGAAPAALPGSVPPVAFPPAGVPAR